MKLDSYISTRWKFWLQYAQYRCKQGGIADEAEDVLQEVILSLLDSNKRVLLSDLMNRKTANGTTELDALILRMIHLNATSDTAPYRARYKPSLKDQNVDVTRLELMDEDEEVEDGTQVTLDRFRQVREVFDSLDFSARAKRIFSYRFFEDEKFSDWQGPESQQELYNIYNDVEEMIKRKINGKLLF